MLDTQDLQISKGGMAGRRAHIESDRDIIRHANHRAGLAGPRSFFHEDCAEPALCRCQCKGCMDIWLRSREPGAVAVFCVDATITA